MYVLIGTTNLNIIILINIYVIIFYFSKETFIQQNFVNHVSHALCLVLILIISTKEVMFLPGFVCALVSLFVNKITQKLMDRF